MVWEWLKLPTWAGTWADWAVVLIAVLSLAVSLLATVVAAVGALAVFLLGRKANNIADKPRQLAEEAERKEAEVLLVFLSGEIQSNLSRANVLAQEMAGYDFQELYAEDAEVRSQIATSLVQLDFRSVHAARERLHVLPAPLSHALARAVGLQRTLANRAVYARDIGAAPSYFRSEFDYLLKWLNVVITDLEVVNSACDVATRFGTAGDMG